LHLAVQWPVAEGTLELITSNQNPIESLFVEEYLGKFIGGNPFANLNLRSLRRLGLDELRNENIKDLLDVVLRSDPQDLHLSFKEVQLESSFEFLTHKLLHRVVDLKVEFG
jgi:hypothetical protein